MCSCTELSSLPLGLVHTNTYCIHFSSALRTHTHIHMRTCLFQWYGHILAQQVSPGLLVERPSCVWPVHVFVCLLLFIAVACVESLVYTSYMQPWKQTKHIQYNVSVIHTVTLWIDGFQWLGLACIPGKLWETYADKWFILDFSIHLVHCRPSIHLTHCMGFDLMPVSPSLVPRFKHMYFFFVRKALARGYVSP